MSGIGPSRSWEQWLEIPMPACGHTAAGTVRDSHPVPFSILPAGLPDESPHSDAKIREFAIFVPVMSNKSKGEFGFIAGIRERFPAAPGVLGIGDDCAVLPQASGMETLVSTDMLIEGTHFLIDDISPFQLGWKSAAVNVSDIAAMGGRPVATFLSLAIPKGMDDEWLDGFLDGYKALSDRFGVQLLGGDTTSSPDRLCINVTVLGECPAGRSIRRSGACIGDLVCVTGHLGDSAAGLRAILSGYPGSEVASRLVRRHYEPMPRVEAGLALAASEGVHAMMDISDGIGSDLRHIMEESHVGAEVEVDAVPLSDDLKAFCSSEGLDPLELAISGGEDYELLFTVAPDCESALAVPHTVIGTITESPDLHWKGSDRDYMGFRHF